MPATKEDELTASLGALPDYVERINVLRISTTKGGKRQLVLMTIWFKGTAGRECHKPNFLLPTNAVLSPGSLILDLVDCPTRNAVWRLRGSTQAPKTKKLSPFMVTET